MKNQLNAPSPFTVVLRTSILPNVVRYSKKTAHPTPSTSSEQPVTSDNTAGISPPLSTTDPISRDFSPSFGSDLVNQKSTSTYAAENVGSLGSQPSTSQHSSTSRQTTSGLSSPTRVTTLSDPSTATSPTSLALPGSSQGSYSRPSTSSDPQGLSSEQESSMSKGIDISHISEPYDPESDIDPDCAAILKQQDDLANSEADIRCFVCDTEKIKQCWLQAMRLAKVS